MDLNGKDPLIDASAEWLRAAQPGERSRSSGRHRISERHRVRRRSRRAKDIKAKIRIRVWLMCAGALLAMVIAIYLALDRRNAGEAGQLVGAPSDVIALTGATSPSAG